MRPGWWRVAKVTMPGPSANAAWPCPCPFHLVFSLAPVSSSPLCSRELLRQRPVWPSLLCECDRLPQRAPARPPFNQPPLPSVRAANRSHVPMCRLFVFLFTFAIGNVEWIWCLIRWVSCNALAVVCVARVLSRFAFDDFNIRKGTSANAGPHYQKLYARVTHIWGNRRSQPSRSAMRGPHPERTPYMIRVPLASGKYALVCSGRYLIG